MWQHNKVTGLLTDVTKYQTLTSASNQACIGLDRTTANGLAIQPKNLNVSSRLYQNDKDGKEASSSCKLGVTTSSATIHGRYIKAYEMGSEISYFKDVASAEQYAKTTLRPLRYWSTDGLGKETDRSVFIVSDKSSNYFDAYTVKENAVIRISLPCVFTSADGRVSAGACIKDGDRMIDTAGFSTLVDFVESVKPLQF